MIKYKHHQWAVLRTPFLSLHQGQEMTLNAQAVWGTLKDPHFDQLLQIVAPELRKKARSAEKSQDPKICQALHDLICRLSRRSQPFSLMAGLSFCRFASLPIESSVKNLKVDVALSPQAGYQLSAVSQYAENAESEALQVNGTAIFSANQISWLAPPKDVQQGWIKKNISLSRSQIEAFRSRKLESIPKLLKNKLIEENLIWKKNKLAPNTKAKIFSFGHLHKSSLDPQDDKFEMFKPIEFSYLNERSLNPLVEAAQALREFQQGDASYRRSHLAIESIANDFRESFDQEFVPFLQYIEDHEEKLKKIFKELDSSVANPKFDSWLINRIDKLPLADATLLALTRADLEDFRQTMAEAKDMSFDPPALTLIAKMTQPEQRWWLQSVIANNPVGYFSRHAHLDKELSSAINDLATEFNEHHRGALVADLMHFSPDRAIQNVMPENDIFPAKLTVSRATHVQSSGQEVHLQDLFLFCRGHRLRLYSKTLKQEIVPTLSHLYNYKIDRNLIFRFLCGLTVQKSPVASNWQWGPLEIREFLPRVEFEKIVVAPARWRVSSSVLNNAFRQGELRQLRETLLSRKIPRMFVVIDIDRRLFFDQDSDLSLLSLLRSISKLASVYIEEYLLPDGVSGPEGPFEHDFIIPFSRVEEIVSRKDLVSPSTPSLETTQLRFSPFSEWTQYNIYLRNSLTSSFLALQLRPFLKLHFRTSQCFFLQYRDPQWHIRLRIRSKNQQRLCNFLHGLIKKNAIASFDLKTYQREIERYGGLEGCRAFEALSHWDSCAALEAHAHMQQTSLSKSEIWAYSAFYSTFFCLKGFGFDKDVEALRKMMQVSEFHEPAQPKIKNILSQIRCFQLGLINRADSDSEKIEKIYFARLQKQKPSIRKILKLAERKELSCTLEQYIQSLIHLSLNRLDADLTTGHEALILKAIFDIQNAQQKNSKATSEPRHNQKIL